MRNVKFIIFMAVLLSIYFSSCKDNSTNPNDDDKDTVTVYKPNLYLYPKESINISVKISFPLGGELIESIPDYNNGWSVTIDTNGVIDNYYNYLFYEYKVPDYHQTQRGWLISKSDLYPFFEENMSSVGFNENEIKDFTDYWIPLLNEFPYYKVYPQFRSTLDKMTEILFSVEPNNFYRLQYLIRGTNEDDIELEEPKIEYAIKDGFYVLEWGVVL